MEKLQPPTNGEQQPRRPRRILIAVQSEGNGHFTQAISIANSLDRFRAWCTIDAVVLNSRKRDTIPSYFVQRFHGCEQLYVNGPIMVRDPQTKKLDKVGLVFQVVQNRTQYLDSLLRIHQCIQQHRIDVVISLFDPLIPMYLQYYRPTNLLFLNVATQFKLYVPFPGAYTREKNVEETPSPSQQHQQCQNLLPSPMTLLPPTVLQDFRNNTAIVLMDSYARTHTLPPLLLNEQSKAHFSNTSMHTIALCPFAPCQNSANMPPFHPTTWFTRPPQIADGSFHALPCFVSSDELRSNIRPMHTLPPAFRHPLLLIDEMSAAQNGVIRLAAYVNIPEFSKELVDYCRLYIASTTSNSTGARVNSDAIALAWDALQQPMKQLFGGVHRPQQMTPRRPFHLFLFRQQEKDVEEVLPNLTCFKVNRVHFLSVLNACDGYVSTAGVESICEALSLEKPILVAPGPDDEEQFINAMLFTHNLEAVFAQTSFQLDRLLQYISRNWEETKGQRACSERYLHECRAARVWLETGVDRFASLFEQLSR